MLTWPHFKVAGCCCPSLVPWSAHKLDLRQLKQQVELWGAPHCSAAASTMATHSPHMHLVTHYGRAEHCTVHWDQNLKAPYSDRAIMLWQARARDAAHAAEGCIPARGCLPTAANTGLHVNTSFCSSLRWGSTARKQCCLVTASLLMHDMHCALPTVSRGVRYMHSLVSTTRHDVCPLCRSKVQACPKNPQRQHWRAAACAPLPHRVLPGAPHSHAHSLPTLSRPRKALKALPLVHCKTLALPKPSRKAELPFVRLA